MMVQLTDEAYPQLLERGRTVVLHIPEKLSIYADPDKMARVFNNLLRNAIFYSEGDAPIEIYGEQLPDAVQIRFENA